MVQHLNSESCSESTPELSESSELGLFTLRLSSPRRAMQVEITYLTNYLAARCLGEIFCNRIPLKKDFLLRSCFFVVFWFF